MEPRPEVELLDPRTSGDGAVEDRFRAAEVPARELEAEVLAPEEGGVRGVVLHEEWEGGAGNRVVEGTCSGGGGEGALEGAADGVGVGAEG